MLYLEARALRDAEGESGVLVFVEAAAEIPHCHCSRLAFLWPS